LSFLKPKNNASFFIAIRTIGFLHFQQKPIPKCSSDDSGVSPFHSQYRFSSKNLKPQKHPTTLGQLWLKHDYLWRREPKGSTTSWSSRDWSKSTTLLLTEHTKRKEIRRGWTNTRGWMGDWSLMHVVPDLESSFPIHNPIMWIFNNSRTSFMKTH